MVGFDDFIVDGLEGVLDLAPPGLEAPVAGDARVKPDLADLYKLRIRASVRRPAQEFL